MVWVRRIRICRVLSYVPGSSRGGAAIVEFDVSACRLPGNPHLNNETDPKKLIQYIHNPSLSLNRQREQLDLLEKLNRLHLQTRKEDLQLEGGIQAMEIAYRMQTEAPEVFDLRKEDPATLERYGEGDFAAGASWLFA